MGIYQPELIETQHASVALGILVLSFFILRYFSFKRFKVALGVIGLVSFFLIGFLHLKNSTEWGKQNHLSTYQHKVIAYMASITKLPEEKEKSWKYEIRILKVTDGVTWNEVEARALLYVRKDSLPTSFFYGDEILVKGTPVLLQAPSNPHEFNFKRFLSFRNIYHQQFVRSNQIKKVTSIRTKDVKYYSMRMRKWATNQLKKQLPDQHENAIALALTLGVTDGIDNDLQNAYAASGAMHVLAVSGLHVGILYGIVLLLFRPFTNVSWSRWLVTGISLMILWSFAFVTGLSPSVLRAVTMFSFIALAKPFGRRTSIYNTLAGSAFLLLLYDPFLIMSVGFQLSYFAVLGIVAIHRPLYQWFEPDNAFVDWIWNITCVSIAAQLAIFSLGLLYFHQFPLYFLFSNLFVIPGAIAVLVTSLMVLATSFIPVIASMLGELLTFIIQALNFGVFTIERIPNSLIENLYITTSQCWLLILTLVFVLLLYYFKKSGYLYGALMCLVLYSANQWYHHFTEVRQNQFIVYNIPGNWGIEWISGGNSNFICDDQLATDKQRIRFHVLPNRLHNGVKKIHTEVMDSSIPVKVFQWKDKTIGVVNGTITSWPQKIKVDYLVVGNNAFRSFEQIQGTIYFDQLILDSTNTPYIAKNIKKQGALKVHSVIHDGAFIKKF